MNAANLVPTIKNGLRFGGGRPETLAADLRALADAVEGGRVQVHRAITREEAAAEGFPRSSVTLVYTEFRSPEPIKTEGANV